MVWEDLTPDRIQTRPAFLNAITVAMALGCSTNAIIHLIAMARRAGVEIGLDDFDRASREVPVLANIRPSGERWLMEDFFYAGGLRGLLSRLSPLLDLSCLSVTGRTLGENLEARKSTTTTSSARSPTRSTPRARSRCYAATSRRRAA